MTSQWSPYKRSKKSHHLSDRSTSVPLANALVSCKAGKGYGYPCGRALFSDSG